LQQVISGFGVWITRGTNAILYYRFQLADFRNTTCDIADVDLLFASTLVGINKKQTKPIE